MADEILEGNELIATFMGPGAPVWEGFERKSYHSSWDWLMPVVEKIANDEEMLVDFKVSEYHPYFEQINTALSFVRIENVWQAVVQFIKWYNTLNTPTPIK